MFDVASSELIVLGMVALLVIPPKDLPKAMRVAGYWIGKVRGVATQFRSGFDSLIRESELAEMEKKWAAENERIMREHPPGPLMLEDNPPSTADDDGQIAPALAEQPAITHLPSEPSPPAGETRAHT